MAGLPFVPGLHGGIPGFGKEGKSGPKGPHFPAMPFQIGDTGRRYKLSYSFTAGEALRSRAFMRHSAQPSMEP